MSQIVGFFLEFKGFSRQNLGTRVILISDEHSDALFCTKISRLSFIHVREMENSDFFCDCHKLSVDQLLMTTHEFKRLLADIIVVQNDLIRGMVNKVSADLMFFLILLFVCFSLTLV